MDENDEIKKEEGLVDPVLGSMQSIEPTVAAVGVIENVEEVGGEETDKKINFDLNEGNPSRASGTRKLKVDPRVERLKKVIQDEELISLFEGEDAVKMMSSIEKQKHEPQVLFKFMEKE